MVEMAGAKPAWVDLASSDPVKAGTFYGSLLGWEVEPPDPAYGGYVMARIGGKDAAGIGPKQMPEQPTAWSIYLGTPDAAALASSVVTTGGNVIVPPFPVGDRGIMTVFQDPAGAFISAWEPHQMGGFATAASGAFAWAELSARGFDRVVPFYTGNFGWTTRVSDMPGGLTYTEFLAGDESVAGGMEMPAMMPAEVPSHWMAYFQVEDIDSAFARALELGGHERLAPTEFPGGRFAIVSDPEGAVFGLMRWRQA